MTATSANRSDINRTNAQHSTGPVTAAGKAIVARNALRHGILSKHTILPGESQEELDELTSALRTELDIQGSLEEIYLQNFVATLWRLKRLDRYEVAHVAWARQTAGSDYDYQRAMKGLKFSELTQLISQMDEPPELSMTVWEDTLAALEDLDLRGDNLAEQITAAPAIVDRLDQWAGEAGMTVKEYINHKYDSLSEFVDDAICVCRHQLHKWSLANVRAMLIELATVEPNDKLNRYRIAFNNELNRTLHTLRQHQRQRTAIIEGELLSPDP